MRSHNHFFAYHLSTYTKRYISKGACNSRIVLPFKEVFKGLRISIITLEGHVSHHAMFDGLIDISVTTTLVLVNIKILNITFNYLVLLSEIYLP
jgi:hypothetical protein